MVVFECSFNVDVNCFDRLVLVFKEVLGLLFGLMLDDVDVEFLIKLMKDYKFDEREWVKFVMGDVSRGYIRNLVDEGNGKSNLVCFFV